MRQKRICCPGLIYHVIHRGNSGRVIFMDDKDYEKYLGLLCELKKKCDFKLFAYCLMKNHAHLLIQVGFGCAIDQIMKNIAGAGDECHFESALVSNDAYLLTMMRYIEQNALRAKAADQIEDFKWSSFMLNRQKKKGGLIDRLDNPAFEYLGKTLDEQAERYQLMAGLPLKDNILLEVRESMRQEFGFTSKRFQSLIKQKLIQQQNSRRKELSVC